VISANKLMMGLTLYGYDWRMGPAGVSGRRASSISNNSAQNLAVSQQTPISFDARSGSPYFRYTVDTERHEVWFEDAMSVAIKLNLVYQYGLRGVSCWTLPNSFPQLWYLLGDTFEVHRYGTLY
jgi:spore germination protein